MERKIGFIAGHMRGGSTLLTLLLGQQEGFFPAGELHRFWNGGFLENELCTCGKPVQSCEFWNAVIKEAFGGWGGVDPLEVSSFLNTIIRIRCFPFLSIPFLRTETYHEKTAWVLDILDSFYAAISQVAGISGIIDSSKISMYGLLLSQLQGIDFYTIHLNRHSCGVAYSKQKFRERSEVHWKKAYMTRHSILKSSYKWNSRNLSASMLRFTTPRFKRVSYERLAKDPQGVISSLMKFLEQDSQDLSSFLDDHHVRIRKNHMFGGNPMRFEDELIRIRPDDEWQEKMPLSKQLVVKLITWPFLIGYTS